MLGCFSVCWHVQFQASDSLGIVHGAVTHWIDDDESLADFAAAQCEFLKARMTKCEVFVCRAIRDSRKKAEHLLKYTSQFTAETESDWKEMMCSALLEKVESILDGGGGGSGGTDAASASSK